MTKKKDVEMSETLFKGRVTELNCLTYFLEHGYIVSTPEITCPYDFLLDTGAGIYRIQVKTSKLVKSAAGAIEFRTSSITHNSNGYTQRVYTDKYVDYFATYWDGECYLVPACECGSKAKRLRLSPAINGQVKNIAFAKDYIAEEVINRLTNK